MSRPLLHFWRWVLACLWLGLMILAAGCLAFGNFVIAWQSFDAQGFERAPLRTVPFLGPWAEAFGTGDAPLASLYALVLVAAMNVAVITCAKLVVRAIQSFFDWRQARRSDDPALRERVADCADRLKETLVWLALLVPLVLPILVFDQAQFSFRYNALFTGLEHHLEATYWPLAGDERVGPFVAGFIGVATWGYIACILAVALALEYAFVRAGEEWRTLASAIQQSVGGSPARLSTSVPAVALTSETQDVDAVEAPPLPAPAVPVDPPSPNLETAPETRTEEVPEPVPPPEPEADELPPVRERESETMVDVIVAPGQTRLLRLTDLEGDPNRYVRDSSGRQWFLRDYYSSIMGHTTRKEAQQ